LRRLNLVVADTDNNYVENLVVFLMSDYSEVFSVTSFTNQDYLVDFLKRSKVDILLISPEMNASLFTREEADVVIHLLPDTDAKGMEGYNAVNRYQHGDKLVSSILRCFSHKNPVHGQIRYGREGTTVVGVYSPAGGVGKSAVAYALSIVCSQMGLKSFYLNMEGFPSIENLCCSDASQSFSNLIYHLKENDKNISLRIEAIKNISSGNGIHYFPTPDSILDFDELLSQDLQLLISHFKSMGKYNTVFIDMSSSFDKRNMSIMNACDEILLILTRDAVCEMKAKALFREAEALSHEGKLNLFDKLTIIINKYSGDVSLHQSISMDISGKRASVILPEAESALDFTDINQFMHTNVEFISCIRNLASKYVKSDGDLIYGC
jgi:cellulose biosynthesis protein BcsQ